MTYSLKLFHYVAFNLVSSQLTYCWLGDYEYLNQFVMVGTNDDLQLTDTGQLFVIVL